MNIKILQILRRTWSCLAFFVKFCVMNFSINVLYCLNGMTTFHVWPVAWWLITVAMNMLTNPSPHEQIFCGKFSVTKIFARV